MNIIGKIRRYLSVFLLLSLLLSLLPPGALARELTFETSSADQSPPTKAAGTDYTATLNALDRPAGSYTTHFHIGENVTAENVNTWMGEYIMLVKIGEAAYAFAPMILQSEAVGAIAVTIDDDYLVFDSEEAVRNASLTLSPNTITTYAHERLISRWDGKEVIAESRNGLPVFTTDSGSNATYGILPGYVDSSDGRMLFKSLYVPNWDQCYITYRDGVFKLVPLAGTAATRVENNTFYFYKLTCLTEPLYNALQKAKTYATGNPNGRYDPEFYAGFEALLLDSLEAYETYNHYLSKEELGLKETIQAALDTRATSLEAYMEILDSGDYSAILNKLPDALGWKNSLVTFEGMEATDHLGLDGTYFIVKESSTGDSYVMDPTVIPEAGHIGGTKITIQEQSVVGGSLSQAIDLVYEIPETVKADTQECYFFRTQDGKFLRGEIFDEKPHITLGHAHQPFGFVHTSDRQQMAIGRKITANADQSAVTATGYKIHFDETKQSFYWGPSGVAVPYSFYRLTWNAEELLAAIEEMTTYTANGGSGVQPDIYGAFLNCLEESIGLYLKYNVSYTHAQLDKTWDIQTELEAQAIRLRSYKEIFLPDYSQVIENLPTPYNELYDGPLSVYHNMDFRSVVGLTVYFVHLDPNGDGTTGWAMSVDNNLYAQNNNNRMYGAPVSIQDGHVLNGQPSYAFFLKENRTATTLYKNEFCPGPVFNTHFGLNNGDFISNNSDHHIAGFTGGGQGATILTMHNDGFTLHFNRNFDGVGSSNDHYFLHYLPSVKGFRPMMKDKIPSGESISRFQMYRVTSPVLELYNAIKQVACYAEGNNEGRYLQADYDNFLACLLESITLYQYYNTSFHNQWDEATLKEELNAQANKLLSHIQTMTLGDQLLDFIDIPVEILDFRADGALFEYITNSYGLGNANTVEDSLGLKRDYLKAGKTTRVEFTRENGTVVANTVTQELTEPDLVDGKLVYREKTLRQIAYTILSGAIEQYANIPGQNNMIKTKVEELAAKASAYDVEAEEWMQILGSAGDTFNKTSTPGKNGGELAWVDITTAYDLAYYILTYLWRPVLSTDIMGTGNTYDTYNVVVPERAVFRLYEDDRGLYTLNAENRVESTGYYVYNAYPYTASETHYGGPSFMPINGLGFEKKDYIPNNPDTDRGATFGNSNYCGTDANYHFTVHAKGSFVYYEEQELYFEFLGDDDVYFFIDGQLVMDLGGGHTAAGSHLDLNAEAAELGLELKDGEVYSFDMFYAERHTTASNLRFSTNMRLMDPDILTTKGQYDGNTKEPLVDGAAVNVGTPILYSFDLLNRRDLPVEDVRFSDLSLGITMNKDGITIDGLTADDTNAGKVNGLTVTYRGFDSNTETLYSGNPKVYTDFTKFKEDITAYTNATDQAQPLKTACSFVISKPSQLRALLAIGIPAGCQLSVYGMERKATEGQYINTMESFCSPITLSESGSKIPLSPVKGSASRRVYGVNLSDIMIPEPLQIVLDYGKVMELPMNELWTRVKVKDKNVTLSYVGLTLNGENAAIRANAPNNLFCTAQQPTATVDSGRFFLQNTVPAFQLTKMMTYGETVYAVYSISGRETGETVAYLMEEVQLLPATVMYYETDFAENIFRFTAGASSTKGTSQAENQDDGTVFPGDAFLKSGNEEKDYSHALFFDFSNNAVDRQRYQQPQYNGANYDTKDAWDIVHSTVPASPVFDSNAGTVSFSPVSNFPATEGGTTANRLDLHNVTDLAFDPQYAEIIQVRLKLEGFARGNDSGFLRLWWWGTKDGTATEGYENAHYFNSDYVFHNNFFTITMNLNSILDESKNQIHDLREVDLIQDIRFSLHNFAVTTASKVTYDYIYIGPKHNAPRQHGQNSLYFTFDNTDSDKQRYEYPQYAGLSPDTEGWISRQYVPNDRSYPVTPVIDNVSGTISATYAKAMTTGTNIQFVMEGLDYPVAQAEILKVRVKLENMIPIEGEARLRLWYRSEGMAAGTSQWIGPMGNIPDTKNGAYINVTIVLDDDFRGRKNLNMLQLAFHEFEVTLDSKVTIDYIYMGPAADAPDEQEMNYSSAKNDFLYFGFENDTQAQNRYSTSTYSGMNFDLLKDGDEFCWDVNEGRCRMPEIDYGSGTMTLVAKYDISDNANYDKGFYVQNGELNAAKQWLNYSPDQAEVAQVRVRFKGFKPTESAKPCIYLRGHMDGVYKEKQGDKMVDICNTITEKVHIDPRFLDSDRYITVSMPINEDVRTNAALLNSIRLNFENITSISTDAYGTVTIDYIYVGPKDSAPEPVYGYDSSYEDDTADSNASSLYAEGLGFKKENSSDPYTRAEFSFTGTGFDLISRTGPDQATIRVKVYTKDDLSEDSCIKTITMNNKGELNLYQIPVVSLQGLAYGTYYVAIDVNSKIDSGYEILKRGNQFYFDAVRIYDPMNVEEEELPDDGFHALTAYLSDKEAHNFTKEIRNILLSAEEFAELFTSQEGAVYVDAQTTPAVSGPASEPKPGDISINDHIAMNVQTYNKTGPKNEVYLAPGQAVAFQLQIPADFYPESVDVGAKTIHGKEVNFVAGLITSSNTGNVLTVANRTSVKLSSCNARYYALNLEPAVLTTETANGTKYRSCYVVLYNNTDKNKGTTGGDYVLSITDIKLAYGIASSIGMEDLPSDPEVQQKAPVKSVPAVRFTVDARAAEAAATLIRAQVETPVIMDGTQLMHSLNLASDISLNYVLAKTAVADYDSFYVQCRIPVYEGSELTDYRQLTLQPAERGEYYYFTLDGLTAVQMNDTIEAVLYCRKDGRLYSSSADLYSIAQYAYAQLAKEAASAKLKTLCADLLRYGSCAQSYKLYRTDSLADAALWAQSRDYLSDLSSIPFGSTNVSGNELQAPTVTWAGKALSLDSKVSMKYVFSTAAYDGDLSDLSLRISYTDLSGQTKTAAVTELEAYSEENSLYAFTFDGLLAAELRAVLTAQIYAGDTPVSVSLRYSPDTYGNGKTGTIGTLCKALFAYSDSARAFFQ